ncbi:MAG: hypothetical protein ACR2JC_15120 [Chloroflexota bacterium]|nr:MAG: hypothetical protein DLM70_04005 [Chloroflexota bacterium]
MNTLDARLQMRQLARDGERLVKHTRDTGDTGAAGGELRRLAAEARDLLTDAGFPGEATWRVLQRASIGVDTAGVDFDASFWQWISEDLESAAGSLDTLLGPSLHRDADLHIVS